MDIANTLYYATKFGLFIDSINQPVETGLIILLGLTAITFIGVATKKA